MSQKPAIVGAGLAGLIAAHAWPTLDIFEASPAPYANHRALLRFRTDAVAKLVGIDFRRVTVRKAIYHKGQFCAPSIQLANAYSRKCTGSLQADRSIWKLDPVERFIAPEDLYEQLIASVGSRIHWNTPAWFGSRPLISTAPMPVALNGCGLHAAAGALERVDFRRAPITVRRGKIPDCDVFQTIYFPGDETRMYRASITGDTLIAEFADTPHGSPEEDWLETLRAAFCLPNDVFVEPSSYNQRFGKILPMEESARKATLLRLTQEHRVFSLGRFATWRNILLDDVVDDISVIKRLMRSSGYDLTRLMS